MAANGWSELWILHFLVSLLILIRNKKLNFTCKDFDIDFLKRNFSFLSFYFVHLQ